MIRNGAYTRFEKSYDRMRADADHIYRAESQFYKGEHLTDNLMLYTYERNACLFDFAIFIDSSFTK